MSDGKRSDNDPSMDDILASIRKIISDDEARAQASGHSLGQAEGGSTATPGSSPSEPVLMRGTRASPASTREDVLLLTDLIEEPKVEPAGARPAPTPIPLPRIDPARAAEMPQPHIEAAESPSLVGSTVAGATSSAFERLNDVVKQSAPRQISTDSGPLVGGNGKTLEELVSELLRPMLKDWLDRNLPPTVERLVEREIARLTRR